MWMMNNEKKTARELAESLRHSSVVQVIDSYGKFVSIKRNKNDINTCYREI